MEGKVIAVVGGLSFDASVLVVSPVLAVLCILVAILCILTIATKEDKRKFLWFTMDSPKQMRED